MAFVGNRLKDFAGVRPDDVALKCGTATWTWQCLVDAIGSVENLVRGATSRGGRVALLLDDPAALLICFLACARTARIAMVLDPGWPDGQRKRVLNAVRPELLIDTCSYSLVRQQEALENAVSALTEPNPAEIDPFYCGFTSGSTGTPKGYLRNHGSWLGSFEISKREFGITEKSRIVLAGQLTHSLHLYGAVCGLANGHEVVLTPRFDPRSILVDLSGADAAAALYATPTQLHFLAEAAERHGPVETVHQVLASGAKWQDRDRERLAETFPKAQLFEFYGASETSFITISGSAENTPPGSVGRPPSGIDIVIGDPDAPVPCGTVGAIWVKSNLLFSGYLCGKDPQTRWRDGWLTFGDEGYLDGNGFLFLTGRSNRMIVTSGLNVYPEEIEAALLSHPDVAAAIVIGLEDPVRGHRLVAAVQLGVPLKQAEDALLRYCRTRLAAGKLPRRILVFENLPLTAGGKPDIQRVTRELSNRRGVE
ncbi:AMP-binding protein [Labrenzia sp. DG1229]|uniref:AMP-binding protein n=1 Tax=Labrenzia sp. DG1229 TaxID=681847 RepID=UPI00068F8540|nr:AMP-binding protein [Labrenzia sp. DG1229]